MEPARQAAGAAPPQGPERQARIGRLLDLVWKSIVIGIVAGLVAVAYRALLALIHNLAFFGEPSFAYDVTVHSRPSPWGAAIVLVPVLGAFGVAFLVRRFATEARGSGVPEVMKAIYYDAGRIRPPVAVVKALASGLSIGTGSPVGREGPIVQIAATFGSALAQRLRLPSWQCVTFIAAGAGAGIAATFDTPIGGVLFAVELMLVEVNARTMLSVTVATALATLIGRFVFGTHHTFAVPHMGEQLSYAFGPGLLAVYLLFGAVMGVAAACFAHAIYACEDLFDRLPGGYYVRHPAGMLLVGLTMYALLATTGHYWVQGISYATVEDVLDGSLTAPGLLLLLFVAKLIVTAVTLGSGASGGIFSPSLFLGATLGEAFGLLADAVFPFLGISPLTFAAVGMAAMIGGATGATLTGLAMVFEMTLDNRVILPMLLTAVSANAVRRVLMTDSVYTRKLARRGLTVPDSLGVEPTLFQTVETLADPRFARVDRAMPPDEALDAHPEARCFLVTRGRTIAGVVDRTRALEASRRGEPRTLGAMADPFAWLDPATRLREALTELSRHGAGTGLVRRDRAVLGFIGRDAIARSVESTLDLVET